MRRLHARALSLATWEEEAVVEAVVVEEEEEAKRLSVWCSERSVPLHCFVSSTRVPHTSGSPLRLAWATYN